MQRAEPKLAEAVERAVADNRGLISGRDLPELMQSALAYWLIPEYTSKQTVTVYPALQWHLLDGGGASSPATAVREER